MFEHRWKSRNTAACSITLMAMVMADSTPAWSQEQTSGKGVTIEQIVVTARKREESMQDVPIAVSAVTGTQLERAFLSDSTELAQFAPNVVFDKVESGTPAGGAFAIRGLGFQDIEKAFDPTVLMTVDGVALGAVTGNVMNLLDIETIEILRGPQGTLFGKNAVGGIINVRRKKPVLDSTFANFRLTAGNYDTNNLEGYANFGAEKVALKLTAARFDHGGYWESLTTGEDLGDRTDGTYGADVLWQPTDTLSIQLKAGYRDLSGSPNPVINISGPGTFWCDVYAQCAPSDRIPQSGDRQKTLSELRNTEVTFEESSFISEVNWEPAEDYTLTYIFGWVSNEEFTRFDFDGTALDLYRATKPADYTQRSHELRLTKDDDVFSWQAGLYAWDADSFTFNKAVTFGGPDAGGAMLNDRIWTGSKSYSVFGESDYRFKDDWVLTTGFRYITEEKTMEKYVDDGVGGVTIPAGTKSKRTDEDFIWRFGLRYEFSPSLMSYFTYSTGFRSGGFSPRANTLEILRRGQDPETLKNYELGVKSELLDSRLMLNAAVFHMKYEDMQIETSIPGGPTGQQQGFDNVGEASLDGIELDFVALLTDRWRLSGNAGWLDAEYEKFNTDLFGVGTPQDFTHLKLRRAPELTYAVQTDYTIPLDSGDLSFRLAYSWRDDYEATLTNHPGTQIKAFGLLDASISYDFGDQWSVSVFGRNLTDEDEYSWTFAVAPAPDNSSFWNMAYPRTPLTYGVEFVYRLGAQ